MLCSTLRRALCLALFAVWLLAACGDTPPSTLSEAERDLARWRVAGEYAEENFSVALEHMEPLLAENPSAEDLLWGAIVIERLSIQDTTLDLLAAQTRALELAQRAYDLAPQDARMAFVLGNLRLLFRELETAEPLFRQVVAAQPDDAAAWLQLALVLDEFDQVDEAEAIYRRIRELGLSHDSPLLYTANHKLSRLLVFSDRLEESERLAAENDANKERVALETGKNSLTGAHVVDIDFGPLTALVPPPPPGLLAQDIAAVQGASDAQGAGDAPSASETQSASGTGAAPNAGGAPSAGGTPAVTQLTRIELPAQGALHVLDMNDDGRLDLFAADGEGGLRLALQGDGESFEVHGVGVSLGLVPEELRVLDADNNGLPEVLLREATLDGGFESKLLRVSVTDGALANVEELPLPLSLAQSVVAEVDADGDVDLLGVVHDDTLGGTRLALLSHAGALQFVDRSEQAGLSGVRADRVWAEDLDGDNDVDLIVQHAGALSVLDNLRGLVFRDARDDWNPPQQAPSDGHLDFQDLDADGHVEILLRRDDTLLRSAWTGESFTRLVKLAALPAGATHWELLDFDLDGHLDLLVDHDGGVSWRRGPLLTSNAAASFVAIANLSAGWRAGDLLGAAVVPDAQSARDQLRERGVRSGEGDGLREFAVAKGGGVHIARAATARGVSVELQGVSDNSLGVDTLVEWRAGLFYGRLRGRGQRMLLGLPAGQSLDILRATWANGIVSYVFDRAAGAHVRVEQPDRSGGSCPFLYTFDGERWVFVTDVLGATPLGLPFAPGMYVPFDHEEAVKIEAQQMRAVDGVVQLAITEELREVTYLDRATLRAVDHPSHVEIQPNDAFVLPPFPPAEVHALAELLPPARALANRAASPSERFADYGAVDRGPQDTRLGALEFAPEQEVSAELRTLDSQVARPFELLPLQFQGLTKPWSLDLEFGATPAEREAIAAAPRVRLVLTGWLQWGDASVNLAAAEHPHYSYEIPVLWRPTAGGWERLPTPIGFPAGKTKSLIVDVTDFIDREDPRLRLTTTLELSWDRVALALDAGDTPLVQTELPALDAELTFRGTSELVATGSADFPELFDWERVDPNPPWDQHPGFYTRYGRVDPLLETVDDEFVILGTGDVITLRFDASQLPPLPDGWTRDWLLDLDGWAKDGDFNTSTGDRVGPLPFHGMTSYPPAPSDAAPDRAAWNAEWNTRAARQLKPVLAQR
ncbi:MAG: hypothetical protein DHS20C15_33570 [Planctomycetota bacterium]|nr:MAG: hypothetical protein DHS20C15_33570 [Planctomycetota bacterium]